jgi:hypothetical protein
MKLLLLITLFTLHFLLAKPITPNEVFARTVQVSEELHFLLDHYNIKHDHDKIVQEATVKSNLKPRHVWQKSYEILIKISMLRTSHELPQIQPMGIAPVRQVNPAMAYEQMQRILTELYLFKIRKGLSSKLPPLKQFTNKTPLDVFNQLNYISASFDQLNKTAFSPSYAFSQAMRIYDDLLSTKI